MFVQSLYLRGSVYPVETDQAGKPNLARASSEASLYVWKQPAERLRNSPVGQTGLYTADYKGLRDKMKNIQFLPNATIKNNTAL